MPEYNVTRTEKITKTILIEAESLDEAIREVSWLDIEYQFDSCSEKVIYSAHRIEDELK